ncbi:MAG: TlpA family protein disulfide reductase [Pyrinomonadaceae bacterium]
MEKIKASFLCLALGLLCFASGGTRNALQAAIVASTPDSVPQSVPSPESCLSKIDQLTNKAFREARESGREVDDKDLRHKKAEIANKCAGAFSINSVGADHLSALAKIYFAANRQSQAYKAISRYLKTPQATDAEKAEILQMAISYSLYSADAAHQSSIAEKYLAQLDQLGALLIRERVSARLILVRHHLSVGDDAKALQNETEIVRLSKMLPANSQKAALDETIDTIDRLALWVCSTAGAGRSRAIIEQIPPELIQLAHAEERIERNLSRYLMDGQEAPQLFPRSVLNAPDSEPPGSVRKGHVTVMLFAAYWCGPCHDIYPHVIDISRKFKADGVQVLLVTQLADPTQDSKAPKPDEELATIRKFYLDEVKITFPIIIEGPLDAKSSGDKIIDQQKKNRQWNLFSFYPMILVIDKTGRTRAILVGTVPGQGERLRTKTEELLK